MPQPSDSPDVRLALYAAQRLADAADSIDGARKVLGVLGELTSADESAFSIAAEHARRIAITLLSREDRVQGQQASAWLQDGKSPSVFGQVSIALAESDRN